MEAEVKPVSSKLSLKGLQLKKLNKIIEPTLSIGTLRAQSYSEDLASLTNSFIYMLNIYIDYNI